LLLLIVGNWELQGLDVLEWHDIHTRFRVNRLNVSKLKRRDVVTHTYTHTVHTSKEHGNLRCLLFFSIRKECALKKPIIQYKQKRNYR
jgi:hypothetical protein